jgi:hypothetical protein
MLVLAGLIGLSQTAFAQTASPSATPSPTQTATSTATPRPTSTQSPTATATPSASLTLNPQQGPAGTSVEGSGSNFVPGDPVQLLFNGALVDTETANPSGMVTFQFDVPNLAQNQYPVIAIGQTRGRAGVNFTIAGTVLSLSVEQGSPGTSVTVTGSGFQPGETVQVSFNNTVVDSPVADTTGSFSSTFTVPRLDPGDYPIDATGQTSGETASATFTIGGASVSLSTQSGDVGSSVTATGAGFTPGDTVQLIFNGAPVDSNAADTNGDVTFTFAVPRAAPGTYLVVLTGRQSGSASAPFTVTGAGLTPLPTGTPAPSTPVPTTPTPADTPQAAPSVPHDNRYFSQTGYRIDNDAVYTFFQSYGGIQTFGYPTSRTFTFLGCPVQFFQRQVIQVCGGQGAALLNILDPEIFPYTKVNGSTFPAPDETMKANTPPVSDPNYAADMQMFVNQNVPNTYGGQQVNFLDYFNSQGGLTIWGAPISNPAPDPANNNFIYQRFQRGIMHYIQGTGTESILVADYLKALILNQNVPLDLLAEAKAQNSPYLGSYCPGSPAWMCKPGQVSGTDYTYAFVPG